MRRHKQRQPKRTSRTKKNWPRQPLRKRQPRRLRNRPRAAPPKKIQKRTKKTLMSRTMTSPIIERQVATITLTEHKDSESSCL